MYNIGIEITVKNNIERVDENNMKDILNLKGYNNALSRLNNSLAKNYPTVNYVYENKNETGALLDTFL